MVKQEVLVEILQTIKSYIINKPQPKMKKLLLSFILLTINIFCFSQLKVLRELEIKGSKYQVQSYNNTKKEIYRIVKLEENSIVSEVTVDKYYKTDNSEMKSKFHFLNNIFIIEKTQTEKNGQVIYGVDRIFIDSKGNLFLDMNNGSFTNKKPELNDYSAQFDGGEKI